MKRIAVMVTLVGLIGVISLPVQAQPDCSSIEGRAVLDFGNNVGMARLLVDGSEQNVEFFSTGFRPTGPDSADIRFVFFFDEGTLVVVEHSSPVPIGGDLQSFDSPVDIRQGGTGGMQWTGIANLATATARFSVTGEVCFDR